MPTRVQIASTVKLVGFAELMTFLEKHLLDTRSFDGCLQISVLLNERTGAMVLDEE